MLIMLLLNLVRLLESLRHFVTFYTLPRIYQPLMFPFLKYGLIASGQAAQTHLNKLLLLEKRAFCFMIFSKPRTHAVPLFISSKILPVNVLYFDLLSTLTYDIFNNSATSLIHQYTDLGLLLLVISIFNNHDLTNNRNNIIHLIVSAPKFRTVCQPKYANCQKKSI